MDTTVLDFNTIISSFVLFCNSLNRTCCPWAHFCKQRNLTLTLTRGVAMGRIWVRGLGCPPGKQASLYQMNFNDCYQLYLKILYSCITAYCFLNLVYLILFLCSYWLYITCNASPLPWLRFLAMPYLFLRRKNTLKNVNINL